MLWMNNMPPQAESLRYAKSSTHCSTGPISIRSEPMRRNPKPGHSLWRRRFLPAATVPLIFPLIESRGMPTRTKHTDLAVEKLADFLPTHTLPFLDPIMPCFRFLILCLVSLAAGQVGLGDDPPQDDGKLRIIVFGAHPDDAEYRAGGCGVKWAKLGHHVKLVSVTNGDIGH